jgi:hypothetical protein
MLKRVILALVSFLLIACSNNSNIAKNSLNNQKIKIYYIHRDNCPACAYMDRVLQNSEVKSIINRDFKVIVVDINHQDMLPDSSMITGVTPTFYYLNNNNKQIAKPSHTLTVKELINKLNEVKKARE